MAAAPDPLRILLADDNLLVLRTLEDRLTASGLRVVGTAVDGSGALELADRVTADVAIVDAGMPDGGPELVRRLQAAQPRISVVVYTAHNDDQLCLLMREAGAVATVLKGAAGQDIVATVRAAGAP